MQYVGKFDAKEINLIKELDEKNFEQVPTLYIGLGGTGKDILLRMRENLFLKYEEKFKDEKLFPIKFLYYDLDQKSSQYDDRGIYSDDYFKRFSFTDDELLLVKPDTAKTLELIKKKQPNVSNISKWISPGLQSMDTSIGAGQQRQISRLSFFTCYNEIERAVKSKLRELGAINTGTKHGTDQTFRIVLVFSVAGGTGCGSFVDMAFLCKQLLKDDSNTANAKHEIISHVVLPGAFKNVTTDADKLSSNGYAALKEIEHYMFPNNNFQAEWVYGQKKSIDGPIFNRCYIISGDRYQNSPSFGSIQEVFNTVADYLVSEIDSSTFASLRNSAVSNCSDFLNNYVFSEVSDKEQGTFYTDLNFYSCKYSSYGLSRIGIPKERIQKACSAQLGLDIINNLKENSIKKFLPNEIDDLAAKFANSFFISINNEKSMPFRELTMYSTADNKTIFDMIDELVNNFIQSDNFKKANNFDSLKVYDAFVKDIISKLILTSNSNEKGEFVKKIQNNLNMIIEEKIEGLKIGEKFWEIFYNNKHIDNHSMVLPNISTNYGIEKTKMFFNKLKEEIEKFKAALDSETKKLNTNLSLNELKSKLAEVGENIKKSNAEAVKQLNALKEIRSKYDEYDEYFKKGDSFKVAEMLGLFKKGQYTLSKKIDDIAKKIKSIENNVDEILSKNMLPLKELLVKTARDEFKRGILIKLINEYYDNYLLEFFKPFEDAKNSKCGFLPIVKINNFEKKIKEIENLLEQRYKFYSNYKVPQSVKIIKDGREITGKDFKGIIKDYYQEVADEFTCLSSTAFCDNDKNKFNEYLEEWKRAYYKSKGMNEKDINEFIKDIIEITDKHDFNKLFDAINNYADNLTNKKLVEKKKFNIFTTEVSRDHAIIKNHEDMMKLSSFCFKQASDVRGSAQNQICRENINFFRWVFGHEIVRTKSDFSAFYNGIANNFVTQNNEDSVNYFSEFHGFPLYFCHIVGKELKDSYNKLKKDFARPLHIEKDNDKFHDLIPIFDFSTVNEYRSKLKVGLMSTLFNVSKYDPEENSFVFNYQRAQGDAEDRKSLKLGQMALEELDENIVHLKKSVSVKEYLESQYRAGEEFKYNGRILSEKGKVKLYFAMLYLNRLIMNSNEGIKNVMQTQINEDKKENDNRSARVISGNVDSLLRDIIDKEIMATNPDPKLFNEFNEKYALKNSSPDEWKKTQALYKAEIFDWIYEDKPAAAIKFRAEDGDFKD